MAAVHLVPISEAAFAEWFEHLVREYAAEHVRTGHWSEAESLERARHETHALLSAGPETPGHHIWSLTDDAGEVVGVLWVNAVTPRPGHAFIYDIEVVAERRGQGLGRAAMLALEDWAREQGIKSIGLHVFGHNTAARRLYASLGYVETNIQMEKRL